MFPFSLNEFIESLCGPKIGLKLFAENGMLGEVVANGRVRHEDAALKSLALAARSNSN